ncbi:MAG: hypothetical protein KUG81_06510 [Gammaproteobacteria bacterium]|nr:hypothetical protein [Gammaproteobacteria bacterium]
MVTLRYNKVKANKDHVCNFCAEAIKAKEHYYNSAHAYEGTVYTWKSHLDCSALLTELEMDGEEGITQDIFVDYVNYAYYDLIRGKEQPTKAMTFKNILDFVIEKRLK